MNSQEGCLYTSQNKKINTAIRLLIKNSNRDTPMIAVCFKGSRVVSWGINKKKTEPFSSTIDVNYRYEEGDGRSLSCNRHAEIDAIKKYKNKQIDLIVIIRLNNHGNVSKSMPCSMCRQYIEDNNISKIIYANWDGSFIIENV